MCLVKGSKDPIIKRYITAAEDAARASIKPYFLNPEGITYFISIRMKHLFSKQTLSLSYVS